MAHDEENAFDSYQKDAFDNPPKGPVGVHRGNTPLAKRVIPYAIVLLVAVLAGLLVYGVYSGDLSKVFSGHQTTQQQTVTPKKKTVKKKAATKDDTKSDDQSNKNETTQQPAATVNKGTAVTVVNATRTSGYAAQKAAVLQQAGYTQVSAVNPAGDVPSSSVVWYQNDSDKATAQDVANLLGISSVQQQSGASSPVEAILLN
ncbi:LytR C-terminal domain-containing protein [Bifidobacterium sp. ESL0790]|uniref:LytR C-terminal domain-containing protein n=1 Tax=Bifidobacterium sp. ESL0790 TaxID=2983233 RepID=UPI0023F9C3BD|nr:LytR C-terminal domain-containing protein [Bifidobacterium sp. ESL0790]WEV71863.1 LytR C-terminal domain-containing protein [Bifidobacterium sp. ESL0790]